MLASLGGQMLSRTRPDGQQGLEVPRSVRRLRARKFVRRAAAASIAVSALVAGDWYLANRELDALLTAVERSEGALERAASGMQVALVSASTPPYDQLDPSEVDALSQALPAAAMRDLSDVVTAAADVEDITIMPWHTG